jgi:hypothetical protein
MIEPAINCTDHDGDYIHFWSGMVVACIPWIIGVLLWGGQ